MRLKFIQNDISCVIEVTNVHYWDISNEFEKKYGLSVLQRDMPQNTGMLFTGLSKKACNNIVDWLFEKGYASLEKYNYDSIELIRE